MVLRLEKVPLLAAMRKVRRLVVQRLAIVSYPKSGNTWGALPDREHNCWSRDDLATESAFLGDHMKIVGVGLNKTGTTTLGLCLRYWGLRHLSFDPPAFDLFKRRNFTSLIEIAKEYDSFEAWPWALLYEHIDRAFPESRFILTTRKSPEVWFDSLCRHAERTGPTEYREHIYGHAMPHGHKADHIGFYIAHRRRVQSYFANRPDKLLTVCWETGDGWRELGNFLRLPVPALPFPHANRSPGPIRARLARIGRQIIHGVG